MNREELKRKFLNYFLGQMPEPERALFLEEVQADPELLKEFRQYKTLFGLTHAIKGENYKVDSAFSVKVLDQIGRSRRTWFTSAVKGMLIPIATAVVIVLAFNMRSQSPELERPPGSSLEVVTPQSEAETKSANKGNHKSAIEEGEIEEGPSGVAEKRKAPALSIEEDRQRQDVLGAGKRFQVEDQKELSVPNPSVVAQKAPEKKTAKALRLADKSFGDSEVDAKAEFSPQAAEPTEAESAANAAPALRSDGAQGRDANPSAPAALEKGGFGGMVLNDRLKETLQEQSSFAQPRRQWDGDRSTLALNLPSPGKESVKEAIKSGMQAAWEIKGEDLLDYFYYEYAKPAPSEVLGVAYEIGPYPFDLQYLVLKIGLVAADSDPRGGREKSVIARDVDINVEIDPQYRYWVRIVGYEKEQGPHKSNSRFLLHADMMRAGEARTVLFLLRQPSQKEKKIRNSPSEIGRVSVQFSTEESLRRMTKEVRVSSSQIRDSVESESDDLRFAAALSYFVALSIERSLINESSWNELRHRIEASLGSDPSGERKQFLQLLDKSKPSGK